MIIQHKQTIDMIYQNISSLKDHSFHLNLHNKSNTVLKASAVDKIIFSKNFKQRVEI